MKRSYSYKHVDMLITARTVCDNFSDHESELKAVNTAWENPFISDLRQRIDDAIHHHLGIDPNKDLKLATQEVVDLQAKALKDLKIFRLLLTSMYAKDTVRKNWLLDTLGFDNSYVDARTGDQESLIEVLYKFKKNLSSTLETELAAKGISQSMIDDIRGYADPLKNANVAQEGLKLQSKRVSADAIAEFNSIYAEVITICRLGNNLFDDQPLKRSKFAFSRLVNALGRSVSKEQKKEQVEPPGGDKTQSLAS